MTAGKWQDPNMFKNLIKYNKTDRSWHLPAMAGICIGIPLLLGVLTDDMEGGRIGSIGALVFLYLQSNQLTNRMIILMVSGFGFILSFAVGILFSFNTWLSPLILALYTFGVHYSLNSLKLSKPPGNFFFIMVISIAITMKHPAAESIHYIGSFTLGVLIAVSIGFLYSIIVLRKTNQPEVMVLKKSPYISVTESIIFSVMMGLSLLVAVLSGLENPYWIPISCLAVMQGASTKHIWTRAIQRVLGTLIGLGLTWVILLKDLSIAEICISIILLQIIIEFFIVRNYAIAVIFISTLTIFLAEPNIKLIGNPSQLISARFFDILIGSAIGAVGGWILHHEHVRFYTRMQLRKTKVIMKKYKKL